MSIIPTGTESKGRENKVDYRQEIADHLGNPPEVFTILLKHVKSGRVSRREASTAFALSLSRFATSSKENANEVLLGQFLRARKYGGFMGVREDIDLNGVLSSVRGLQANKLVDRLLTGECDDEIWNLEISPEEGLSVVSGYLEPGR